MAARTLRRLQRHTLKVENDDDDEEESDDEPIPATKTSGFAALMADDDDDEDEEDEEDEDEDEDAKRVGNVADSKESARETVESISKTSKGMRSKASHQPVQKEEDLDELIAQIAGVDVSSTGPSSSTQADRGRATGNQDGHVAKVLSVDARYLSPDRELRQMFGSDAVSSSDRNRHGNPRGRHRTRRLRKFVLVNPPDGWPKPDVGLSMIHIGTEAGVSRFKYELSAEARHVQEQFEAVAATFQPQQLVDFLHRHPFHLDTLMNLSYIHLHSGDYTTADALIQRCIFVLESAFHPWFDVTSGTCRLEFAEDENQIFFKVISRYITSLTRRGCHRSALEATKLLLTLDEGDPLGLLFNVDYLCIRSREYEFLLRLVSNFETMEDRKGLALYPNFAFSSALARFYIDKESVARRTDAHESEHTSNDMVLQAMTMYPFVVESLIDKLESKGGGVKAAWNDIFVTPVFKNSSSSGSASLSHLAKLFVERNYELWRPSDVQAWLLGAAKDLVAHHQNSASDVSAIVADVFPPSDVNEYRHVPVIGEGVQEALALPEDVLHPQNPVAQGQPRMTAEQLQEAGVLQMFLSSLLPWNNV